MAAANLSAAPEFHFTVVQQSHKRIPIFFPKLTNQNPTKRLHISCSKNPKTPSLSEQLKPLSSTTLPTTQTQTHQANLLVKPKSTWVNPARPKRSVLSLHRQKRSPYPLNPKVRELRLFAKKLCDCDSEESAFTNLLRETPYPLDRDNSLLVLNSLRPWEKAYMFFNWIDNEKLFPMETIFYNVAMKSLRFGKQFGLIEKLANQMVSNEVELDNITYSTIITCAKRCNMFDKALEWFERMYKTGLMPDEVTYSAVLDVYAKLGKVEEVLSLYERGVASGWKPDPITFSVLAKMFGEAGDYDGIRYVLQEMKSLGVQSNVVVYNTLLEAMGKAGKPGMARSLFEEMVDSGLTPNEKTLTALIKIYGKARWAKDAMDLWDRMRSNNWPMDFILYNTLLSMCADLGLEEEAEKLFEDMKRSEHCRPDSWSYTAMLNIYGSGGNADKAMETFEEMSKRGIDLNVMGCTCLIQCLGKARRIDDLVKVFNFSVQRGVRPDDKLCGCLLSVVSLCEKNEDVEKVLGCLQQANPRLVAFVQLIKDENTSFETLKEEFKSVVGGTAVEARRPFCNCLIDDCRKRNLHSRAHELLYLGTLYGLYPDLHNKTADEWSLDVRSLSVGAAYTALEEWMGTLMKFVERNEALPEVFSAHTGTGTHKFSQGLANGFASHIEKLGAPFRQMEGKAGCFTATREDMVNWVKSRSGSPIPA
ncbi:pentatricopeptide (PPR) repeat-containing protein [Euphorbia peplus]|nr:pentatricopeptide (PPR) repeat-containing protein [Euphorbia peplus]